MHMHAYAANVREPAGCCAEKQTVMYVANVKNKVCACVEVLIYLQVLSLYVEHSLQVMFA